MVIVMVVLQVGCGSGSGDFADDAGVAADASVALDLGSRSLSPLGKQGGTGSGSRIIFQRVSGGHLTVGRVQADNLVEVEERPTSDVQVSEYLIASTELTRAQWLAFDGSAPWTGVLEIAGGTSDISDPELPAVGMTRTQVEAFCERFSPSGWRLALPTPAQWEHAALAGAATRFSWGDSMGDSFVKRHANVWLETPSGDDTVLLPHTVGLHQANGYGLFDMHGNVWEMTSAGGATKMIVCGGAWDQPVLQARASNRMEVPADVGLPTVGVRLILVKE